MTTTPTTDRDVRIVAVPATTLRRLRAQGYDDTGTPLTVIPGGRGRPVRCCLRRTTEAERVILISYAPVRPTTEFTSETKPYDEVGPIFVHAEECAGPDADGEFPAAWRDHPQVLRTYGPDGRLLDGVLTRPDEDRMAIAARLLAPPGVAFVHARSVGAGCFSFELRRRGDA